MAGLVGRVWAADAPELPARAKVIHFIRHGEGIPLCAWHRQQRFARS